MTDPGDSDPLDLTFKSRATDVRAALGQVADFTKRHQLTPEDQQAAEVVVAELLNNIVEHAYLDDPRGTVTLAARLCGGSLCVEVTDQGRPMPGLCLPAQRLPASDGPLDTLPEGGFGWFLIHSMTENLRYLREGRLNITRFSIRLGPG